VFSDDQNVARAGMRDNGQMHSFDDEDDACSSSSHTSFDAVP
jgi:hypothetical protein